MFRLLRQGLPIGKPTNHINSSTGAKFRHLVTPRPRACWYSPPLESSGATRLERSGSSPYQKTQSSLADWRREVLGHCPPLLFWEEVSSNVSREAVWGGGLRQDRRHTHSTSAERQRAYEVSTGSSRGSRRLGPLERPPPNTPAPPPLSHVYTRHLIPHKSVWEVRVK